MALMHSFRQLVGGNEEPSFLFAFLFAWNAFFFGTIAATGRFETSGTQRQQLFMAAKEFVDGEMTLDEYGSRTKDIMNGT